MKKFIVTAAVALTLIGAGTADAFTWTPGQMLVRVGSRGAQVMELQQCLAELGNNPESNIDGIFGNVTKTAVMSFQASKGIMVDGIIGPVTGPLYEAACKDADSSDDSEEDKDSFSTNGDAGDLLISSTSAGVESNVKEGDEENVLGLKVEADGSDINITSIEVMFENNSGNGSTRFDRYVDEVIITLDGEEVGSEDADRFSKDGSEYSRRINLKDAIVSEKDTVELYVVVKTLNRVDDLTADFDVTVENIRFVDESGMSISENRTETETFGFDDISGDDKLSIKSSSNNPVASTLKVEKNGDSDDHMVLSFRMEADEDGSDITLYELPIVFTVSAGGNDADSIEDIIDEVIVTIDGDDFEADYTSNTVLNGVGTGTYTVDVDADAVIDAGDTVEVEVTVIFKEQEGNYANGTKISAQVAAANIDAEGEDVLSGAGLSGTASGKTHTLDIAGAVIDNFGWSVNASGAFIDFTFDVESDDEDFTINIADIIANDTITGTADVAAPVLSVTGGDADEDTVGAVYTVLAGDSASFQVRYAVTGANGTFAQVKITSAAGQEVENSKQTSPTAVRNIQSYAGQEAEN